ncbi:hypothetical protein [Streptomyces sp. NPDC017260]|uniref:hypothetical protein n=1 Tax=Streptomyces sp. NPDC017260 TaxID=3364992 RepID=UPI0037BDDACE
MSSATGTPNATASRLPGRPACATAIEVSIPRSSEVKRACGLVSLATCSTNVTAEQAALRHRNRRTSSSITTRASR